MKKGLIIVLSLLCLISFTACDTKSMNYIIKNKPSVVGTVEEVHENYILMYSDSAEGYPYGSRWQISLDVESKDNYTAIVVGDEIVVYHDGNVMETDPLKVGKVHAITLRTPADRNMSEGDISTVKGDIELAGISADEVFAVSVSYANWTEESNLYFGALNKEKMVISSVLHLPIYKFDTLADLNQFKKNISDILSVDASYDEMPSFNDTTSDYDEAFFENNTLLLVYVSSGSGTYRYGVESIFCENDSFCVQIKQLNLPEVVTMDMAGWFVTVAVPDYVVEDCNEFDAFMNYSTE